ncbi:BA14K family protein [Aquabacter cavernae]|uniref:BA14K family protein n=1 Tax=Aquabacter cavernae TaxID=2496029 RepID=UPI001FDF6752|nr:BA14K family protein [Aquabacter cavernae]
MGSAIAAPPPVMIYGGPPGGNAVAYCMQRFRSYNPATGTYLGYDGRRHACP